MSEIALIDQLPEPDRYLAHCLRTWDNTECNAREEQLHAALGIGGEMREFIEAVYFLPANELLLEAGDVAYYITILRFHLNINVTPVTRREINLKIQGVLSVQEALGVLWESLKKIHFQGKDDPILYTRIRVSLETVMSFVYWASVTGREDKSGSDLEFFQKHVLDANVAKLQVRWPETSKEK